jgi:hypothetical protein
MSAIENARLTDQSWKISDFFSKIGDLVNQVWVAVRNLFCYWMQPPLNPSLDETALKELKNKFDQYNNLNRPLNDMEKADLKKKKEETEEIFKQAKELWKQADVRVKTPPFMQYEMSPLKKEIERLF